jgi:hypothetical protein
MRPQVNRIEAFALVGFAIAAATISGADLAPCANWFLNATGSGAAHVKPFSGWWFTIAMSVTQSFY